MILTGCGNAAPKSETTPKVKSEMSIATKMENMTEKLPPIVSQVKVHIKKDCGAKGDGVTNDTAAFQKAATLIQQKGGGTLVIPKGTYIVGRQSHQDGQYPYYKSAPMFAVKDLNGLLIEGNDATLRLASGLRYGSFDKESGAIYNSLQMPFTDYQYRVGDMPLLAINDSRNVVVRNLELDGNLSNLVLGGAWGDTGRQIGAYGLQLYNNRNVHIDKVHAHHHALDGIVIGYAGLKENDPATPHTLTDCVFEYNGRQGLSWVGGRGLKALRCKFNHTGRAVNGGALLASAPGAGLDIEAEDSVTRDGYFEVCEFIDNAGVGAVADSGDGGYTKFKNCTFWGTTSWSIWSRRGTGASATSRARARMAHANGALPATARRCARPASTTTRHWW